MIDICVQSGIFALWMTKDVDSLIKLSLFCNKNPTKCLTRYKVIALTVADRQESSQEMPAWKGQHRALSAGQLEP